jgi:hypothetical protein
VSRNYSCLFVSVDLSNLRLSPIQFFVEKNRRFESAGWHSKHAAAPSTRDCDPRTADRGEIRIPSSPLGPEPPPGASRLTGHERPRHSGHPSGCGSAAGSGAMWSTTMCSARTIVLACSARSRPSSRPNGRRHVEFTVDPNLDPFPPVASLLRVEIRCLLASSPPARYSPALNLVSGTSGGGAGCAGACDGAWRPCSFASAQSRQSVMIS